MAATAPSDVSTVISTATPYVIAILSIICGLLSLVYWHLRDALDTHKTELGALRERFDKFREQELKEIATKMDSMTDRITQAIHGLELGMAKDFVTKTELERELQRLHTDHG